jgi:methionyl-tRNA synthetase
MINTFIKPGLEDLCVSRTTFSWGIPLHEDPKHVVYVWLDALTNYITALGYGSDDPKIFKKFWADPKSEIVHVIGADITRFHAIYWPMFLMSLGLRLPDRLFVHGLLMMKDGKMSKSKGNVVDPVPLIAKYGVDALRYYLVRETVFGSDGQFTPEQFIERINMDLANDFGNLLNRTVTMIEKYFNGLIPSYKGSITAFDEELKKLADSTIQDYVSLMDDLKITEAYTKVLSLVGKANKYIDETQPWALAKDPSKKEHLESVMIHLASILYIAGVLLQPVLTRSSKSLFEQLGVDPTINHFKRITQFGVIGGCQVKKGSPLFPRLDPLIEVPYIADLMTNKK